MRRREFIALVGGIVGVPLGAEAQQEAKIARIGWLGQNLAPNPEAREAFRRGMRDLGYVEGRNLVIEYRDAEGNFDRLPALAAELVALNVDVIVAPNTAQVLAAKQATTTIPIVFALAADPVGSGLVTALRGRVAMPPGLPTSPWTSSASVWNCSRRPFLGSFGSLSSGCQVSSADARKRTC